MDEQIEAAKEKETYWAERVDELHCDLNLKEDQRIKEVADLEAQVMSLMPSCAWPVLEIVSLHGI